jgi:hypothetical protein
MRKRTRSFSDLLYLMESPALQEISLTLDSSDSDIENYILCKLDCYVKPSRTPERKGNTRRRSKSLTRRCINRGVAVVFEPQGCIVDDS